MSMNNFFQFLSSMLSGTGQAMADVMIEVLSEWGVKNCIKALSFDTTSSNTGRKNGACVLVKCSSRKKLSTWLVDIISMKFFLKRHSALQWGLPLDLTFYFSDFKISSDFKNFKRFKAFWTNILISNFKSGIEIQSVAAVVLDFSADVSAFCISPT